MGKAQPRRRRGRRVQSRAKAAGFRRIRPARRSRARLIQPHTRSKSFLAMATKPRYFLTTAIAYANGAPHIGHAYEAIATDAIARFMRLDGYDVFFLTGTDEHGQKVQQTAAQEGLPPREVSARNVARCQAMVARMNCSNDDFIRTTEPRHHRSSQAIWERMAK